MQIEDLYDRFRESEGISTDTRTLKPDHLFIALSGDNFDGNTYVQKALDQGAHHVICTDPSWESNDKVTVVKDSLKCLQELSTHHRNFLKLPIVALTGSNGKTTTKELILSVLQEKFQVRGTKGNLNNHIGVPLTLLTFDENTEIGVVEMGANHIGEIAALCAIAQPDYGLITNFGKAHLEGFGSLEGVKMGKSEIYEYLKSNDGKAIIVNSDPEQLARTAGLTRREAPSFELLHSQPISFDWDGQQVTTQLTGSYNLTNMELAAAVGLEMKVPKSQIISGLTKYVPENNRSQILKREHYTIIKDAYNANPTSMKAALENLALQKGHKIAIVGDMFELGSYARDEHQSIANLIENLGISESYLIGSNFAQTTTSKSKVFETFEEFKSFTNDLNISKGSVILLKGSRGMALERILEII